MNPEIIYSNFRDEALAYMFSADKYSIFVAMPFRGRFSYDPDGILKRVIQKAAVKANKERDDQLKEFQMPEEVVPKIVGS